MSQLILMGTGQRASSAKVEEEEEVTKSLLTSEFI
jgi:hypothetical protein